METIQGFVVEQREYIKHRSQIIREMERIADVMGIYNQGMNADYECVNLSSADDLWGWLEINESQGFIRYSNRNSDDKYFEVKIPYAYFVMSDEELIKEKEYLEQKKIEEEELNKIIEENAKKDQLIARFNAVKKALEEIDVDGTLQKYMRDEILG